MKFYAIALLALATSAEAVKVQTTETVQVQTRTTEQVLADLEARVDRNERNLLLLQGWFDDAQKHFNNIRGQLGI